MISRNSLTVMGLSMLLLSGVASLAAAEEQTGSEPTANQVPQEVTPDSLQQGEQTGSATLPDTATPQGPAEAPGPVPAVLDATSYQPIPESRLPVGVAAATEVPGRPAPLPGQTNLGGAAPVMPMGPYTLGRDDVVQITVQSQPTFSGTYVIGPNGAIQYGFVGDVKADGLTKDELRDAIADALKKYVRIPTVQVAIVGFNSKAIYILGQVAKPGKYSMRGDSIKVRDAVIAAGLVTTHAALSKVHIIKSDPNDPSYKVVNLKRVLFKGQMRDNVDLINGDIVVVPTTFWGKITGFIASITNPASHAGTVAALAAL